MEQPETIEAEKRASDSLERVVRTLHVQPHIGQPAKVFWNCPNCGTTNHSEMEQQRKITGCRDCGWTTRLTLRES